MPRCLSTWHPGPIWLWFFETDCSGFSTALIKKDVRWSRVNDNVSAYFSWSVRGNIDKTLSFRYFVRLNSWFQYSDVCLQRGQKEISNSNFSSPIHFSTISYLTPGTKIRVRKQNTSDTFHIRGINIEQNIFTYP